MSGRRLAPGIAEVSMWSTISWAPAFRDRAGAEAGRRRRGVLLVGPHHVVVPVDVGLGGLDRPGERGLDPGAHVLQPGRLDLEERLERGKDGATATGSRRGELDPALQRLQDRAELLGIGLGPGQHLFDPFGVDLVAGHAPSPQWCVVRSADAADGTLGALQRLGRRLVVAAERSAEHVDDALDLVGHVVPALLLAGVLLRDAVCLVVRHRQLDVTITLVDQRLEVVGHDVEGLLRILRSGDVVVPALDVVTR